MNKCLYCGKPVKNKYCDVSCQNKHQNAEKANKKFGQLKKINVLCKKCGNEFEVEEREKLFPIKNAYYCSKNCANSRTHKEETKQKIRNSVIKTYAEFSKPKIQYNCLNCGNSFENKKKRTFCSISCSTTWRNLNTDFAKKGGRQSVLNQNKRSKNEILFAELCVKYFSDVKLNEPIFNGWDADIIIEDHKLAILWNGNWHHKQIGIKHSLLQTQNRDRLKMKEIENCGYTPYIIDDFGKYNVEFVNKEFEKLKEYLKK